MPSKNERQKYTVPQLSRLWGVSQNKVLEFVRRGELRAVNLASHRSTRPRYAIDVADIAAFERAREVFPSSQAATLKPRRRATGTVKEYF